MRAAKRCDARATTQHGGVRRFALTNLKTLEGAQEAVVAIGNAGLGSAITNLTGLLSRQPGLRVSRRIECCGEHERGRKCDHRFGEHRRISYRLRSTVVVPSHPDRAAK